MNRLLQLGITSLLLCQGVCLHAQDAGHLLLHAAIEKLENAREYTLSVAELMPADAYDFRPTGDMMSFSGQLVHLSYNMGWLTSAFLSEGTNPVDRSDAGLTDKRQVMAVVERSYDYALDVLRNFDVRQLDDTVSFFAGPKTKLQIFTLLNDHQTHHRGQLLVYLRLKGIVPPRYKGW
jgi:uncharacterized damage-inducible protein DinB